MSYNKLYDDVRFATELVKFAYLNGNAKSIKSVEEYLIKIKRIWRNHIHAKNGWERKYKNVYVTILNDSIDGATIKLFFQMNTGMKQKRKPSKKKTGNDTSQVSTIAPDRYSQVGCGSLIRHLECLRISEKM